MKKWIVRLLMVLVAAAAGWGGYTALKKIPEAREGGLPTAKVRQGDIVVRTFARGELRAVRSMTLTAPNLFGTVQVTKLAPLGAFAREKDLVVEFDDAELQSRIEEKQLELDQLDEQIKKSKADLAIRDNQDQVELLRARYSVRRAELEVKRNDLISKIDARKNELTLEESERRLKQLESDIKSRREQAQAELAVLAEKKTKADQEMARERTRLRQVKMLSPMSGLVAIRQNRGFGFFSFGQQAPDIREGDQLQPGMPVADILDLSELEIVARVGELDRANLHEGQDVEFTLDALADKRLHGKIKSLSGTASANVFSSDPAKKFDVLFAVDMRQLMSSLGATPEQISRILAQAEANRKKAPAGGPAMMAGGPMMMMGGGGRPGGGGAGGFAGGGGGGGGFAGAPGGGGGDQQGGQGGGRAFGFQRPGGGQGGGGQAGGAASGLTAEQQQKMRAAMQKALNGKNMQDLTPEERQEIFTKVREEMQKEGISMPARGGRKGGDSKGGETKAGETKGGERPTRTAGPDGAAVARGEGGGGRRNGGGGGGPRSGPSDADLANAKLPPPPEEDSNLDVLMRPGLLADVEIIVERIPNAINVPMQAIFQREGKTIVFVKEGRRFAARAVKPLKRSESVMVIAEGLKPGEEVALQDPDAKPGEGKKGKKGGGGEGGGGGAPMMPAGGGKRG
ncbi:MAG: efflux RND transporter periplasmic adaptor subunit [Bryobacteraceae bacterium]